MGLSFIKRWVQVTKVLVIEDDTTLLQIEDRIDYQHEFRAFHRILDTPHVLGRLLSVFRTCGTVLDLARTNIWLMMLILVISGCRTADDTGLTPAIIYLGWDENERIQIFQQYPDDLPIQLTSVDDGVVDFAVAPDAETIVFSTPTVGGTSTLWRIDEDGRAPRLMLTCPYAECSQPVWASDSRRLIYEQRIIGDDGIPGSPYLWWLDTETGETKAVVEDSEARGKAARFSADGQWLSYFSPEEEGAVIYNLQDGQTQVIVDEIGAPVTWSPVSNSIIVPNLELVIIHGDKGDDHLQHTHDYETAVHLFMMDVQGGELSNISGDLKVEDSVPAWSPNEEWIAFGRRFPGTAAGRQLWVMRPDGTEARALTNDPAITYGPPSWTPDGRHLLFQRFDIEELDGDPGIWLLDVETGQESELVFKGMQPTWLVDVTNK